MAQLRHTKKWHLWQILVKSNKINIKVFGVWADYYKSPNIANFESLIRFGSLVCDFGKFMVLLPSA